MKKFFISVVLLIAHSGHVQARDYADLMKKQQRERASNSRQSLQEFIERANQLLGIVLNNVNNAPQASNIDSAPPAVASVVESPAENNAVVSTVESNVIAIQESVSPEQPAAVVAESVVQSVEESISVNSIT